MSRRWLFNNILLLNISGVQRITKNSSKVSNAKEKLKPTTRERTLEERKHQMVINICREIREEISPVKLERRNIQEGPIQTGL